MAIEELSEDLARTILDGAVDMVFGIDAEGRFLFVNEALCQTLGYGREEMLGLYLWDIDPLIGAVGDWSELWEMVRQSPSAQVSQSQHRTRDGRIIPVEISARYCRIGDEEYVFAFSRDISQRQQRERDYQELLDNLPVAVVHHDAAGKLTFCNAYARQMTGYSAEELGQIPLEAFFADAGGRDEIPSIPAAGGEIEYEFRLQHKDGRVLWVRGKSRMLQGDEGQVYFQSIAQDATQQKRREDERLALHTLRDAVWKMTGEADIERVVATVRQTLERLGVPVQGCSIHIVDAGRQPPEVQTLRSDSAGTEWLRPVNVQTARTVVDMWRAGQVTYRRDLAQEDAWQERGAIEMQYTHQVRSVLDVPYSHGTLGINNQRPDAFSPEDIAAVEQVAEVISEGFLRLEDLKRLARRAQEAETLAAAIAVVAATDRLDEVFAAVVREATRLTDCERSTLFLYSEDEEALVPQAHIGHDEGYSAIRLKPGEDLSGSVYQSGQARLLVPGQRPTLRESRRPETAALFEKTVQGQTAGGGAAVPLTVNGQIVGVLSVGSSGRILQQRDVDMLQRLGQQVALAIERAQRRRSLEERNAELVRQEENRRRLESQLREAQKMEAVGQLTAGIAHNFNNLLQIIRGNLFLAQEDSTQPEVKALLGEVDDASQRAADMVQHLLVFSRRGLQPDKQTTDLAEIVRGTTDICRRTFDRKIVIDLALAPEPLPVSGNPSQLEQVLLNLCLNARDALEGQPQPHIRLRAEAAADTVCVEVEDNGVGMDEQTRQRVFEPFFTTKDVDRGTGLGLSTVYGIVHQHKGRIECRSRPGAGTTFTVVLPKTAESVVPAPAADGAPAQRGGEAVLIVEDETLVRETTAQMLRRQGYEVLEAGDGVEGAEVFKEKAPDIDLVLLDLSMPRVSGPELLVALRRQDPEVKVIVMTGYVPNQDEIAGAAGVLAKPFMPADLMRQVRQVLDGAG